MESSSFDLNKDFFLEVPFFITLDALNLGIDSCLWAGSGSIIMNLEPALLKVLQITDGGWFELSIFACTFSRVFKCNHNESGGFLIYLKSLDAAFVFI